MRLLNGVRCLLSAIVCCCGLTVAVVGCLLLRVECCALVVVASCVAVW